MNPWALLALGVVGYFVLDSLGKSAASTATSQGSKVMNVSYNPPILLASVNGITFSASWSATPGSPISYWIFAYASDINFTQNYVEVQLDPSQVSVSNNQANATYFFRLRFVDGNGVMSPWSNPVGPLTSGAARRAVSTGAAAPVVPTPISSTSTASNIAPASTPAPVRPIPTTTIQQVYPTTSLATAQANASGESPDSVDQVTAAIQTEIYDPNNAALEALIGQPSNFLQMIQQLFSTNPQDMDALASDVKTYYNSLITGGPGGNISVWNLSLYYGAIAEYGSAQAPSMFAYWQANGMLAPLLLGANQVAVPALLLS
jgi:hypothetical protein